MEEDALFPSRLIYPADGGKRETELPVGSSSSDIEAEELRRSDGILTRLLLLSHLCVHRWTVHITMTGLNYPLALCHYSCLVNPSVTATRPFK